MSAIEQKRQEYINSLQKVRATKQAFINQKVEEYRRQLIAQQNHDDETKLQSVIDALAKVIEYEKGSN